jgi:hypothetical protein
MLLQGSLYHIKKTLSEIPNILLITNVYTKEFAKLLEIENAVCVNPPLNIKLLFSSLENCFFLSKELFFYKLEKLYKDVYDEEIKELLQNPNTVSPLGVANTSLSFTNEEDILSLPLTMKVSEEFFMLHKISCSLKPLKSILITIIFHFSYLLKDLYELLILEKGVIIYGLLNFPNRIFKSFSEGIGFLEKDGWVFEKKIASYHRKNSLWETFIYWQRIFEEEEIKICSCHFTTHKDLNKYTYYGIKENILLPIFTNNKNKILASRNLLIPLKTPQIIDNPKKFYMEKILGYKPFFQQNKKTTKPKSLRISNFVEEFKLIY